MKGMEIIERLRKEDFNLATERKLAQHPYVLAAEAGTLTVAQKRAFCYEQYAIQRSDAISFACLAGHVFRPKSLTGVEVPEGNKDDLFQFLLGGEVYASGLLLKQAKSLGIKDEEALATNYKCSSLAQAYPSYWARLALDDAHAAGAAACAVNFPAWGHMCLRLCNAAEDTMEFTQFFATSIDNLDEMAAAVMDGVEEVQYNDLVQHVRLLQEYEVLFWDAVYAAKDEWEWNG